jgi:hypothetical protein
LYSFLEKQSRLFALLSKWIWKELFFYDDYTQIGSNPRFVWPQNQELYAENPYAKKLWLRLIKEMQQSCFKKGIGFTVITTGYLPDSILNPRSYKVYSKLDSLLNTQNIPFIDLRQEMDSVANGDIKKVTLWPDNHPNDLGTEIISNAIIKQWVKPEYQK